MLILFDHSTPAPLRYALKGHVVVLGNAQWPVLRLYVDRVVAAVNAVKPGSFAIVDIPRQFTPPHSS